MVAATCRKRGIEVPLDIHIVFIHPEIYLSSTRLTTVPDCQVWQGMGTGDDVCKGDESMIHCFCRLGVQFERYVGISGWETDSSWKSCNIVSNLWIVISSHRTTVTNPWNHCILAWNCLPCILEGVIHNIHGMQEVLSNAKGFGLKL